jgi:carbon-monoxide dehydrogenase medium subunit
LRLLAAHENVRVLAGGQSLMAMLNMRFAFPDHLVDINGLQELGYIREDGGNVVIGALTRQRDVEFSTLVQARLPLLAEAILQVGHRQTRNRGTVGGSLCQLDPAAEIPTVAMALDAVITVANHGGTRQIAMSDFPAGYMTPSMEPDELLTAISFTPWPTGHGSAFIEFARRHGDFAIVSVAVLIAFDAVGNVARASITLGGVGSGPVRMSEAEAVLIGSRADDAVLARAAQLCAAIDASSDAYVPAWYRQRLAGVLSRRALDSAISRAQR